MKYERSDEFKADYKRLSKAHKKLFTDAIKVVNDAYKNKGDRPLPNWPATLRIKDVEGKIGVFELTWSFSKPDGRATFEYTTIDDEPAIRWRRVGTHKIFKKP